MKIFTRSRRDLAAISARIAARSRRDRGAFLAAEISPSRRDHGRNRGEITARYGKSRRPKTRRDLAAILAEMREISAAKNAPRSRRHSRRDAGNLGGQKRAAISPPFSPRCGKSRRPKTRRDLAAILAEMREISAAKNAPRSRRDRSEIWKSRQANTRRDVAARSRRDTEISAAKTRRDREVISRRDMDISAGSFAARSRWESCRDLRRETKFLAVKILLLSRREAKFSAAKLGSMRTIFTFTLTINQTTRR